MLPNLLADSAAHHASIEECFQAATSAGFTVFSLQYGGECFASNDFARATSAGVSSGCTMPCDKNPSATCGGPNANSVYSIRGEMSRVCTPSTHYWVPWAHAHVCGGILVTLDKSLSLMCLKIELEGVEMAAPLAIEMVSSLEPPPPITHTLFISF